MNYPDNEISSVYRDAMIFAADHYENFPVISRFLSREIRPHIAIIYQFARTADDIADEGNLERDERLIRLDNYRAELISCLEGNFNGDFWRALRYTVDRYGIDPENLIKLLKAFRQDVVKKRYANFEELLSYCENSANPVGRIILQFHGIFDGDSIYLSDKICTALQITNFLQDVSVDFGKGRIYIPQDEMAEYGVTESQFSNNSIDENFRDLMEFQHGRIGEFFEEGSKLVDRLPGSLKYQIKWTILGGEEILVKIQKIKFDVLKQRPKLTKYDYFRLMIQSLFK